MKQTYLITGATGMIGTDLVNRLLQTTESEIIITLNQTPSNIPEKYDNRVQLIHADITQSIENKISPSHKKNITHIIHAAAKTRFDLPIDTIRQINVEGTRNIMHLAQKLPNLENTTFLSTAYVTGTRSGTMCENDENNPPSFVNTYERSKYEAEKIILQDKNSPWSILRLSTIIGDSKTGEIHHFTAPHHALRIIYLGLASMLPGTTDYKVNFIPSDYTTNTLFHLITKNKLKQKIYHLTAPNDKCYTLQELIDQSYQYLSHYDHHWVRRNYSKPVITNVETFELFLESARQANNTLIASVLSALGHFAHQLVYPKKFDSTNIIDLIPDYEKNMPHISSYYDKIVKYCLNTKWGRNVE